MSILDSNINPPMPEVSDWWDIGLRFNPVNLRPFIPDESLNHLGDLIRWTEFVRRKILRYHCNADDHMLTYICESIIKSELIDVEDVQVGWPIIRDGKVIYTAFIVTYQRNKESIGTIETKLLHQ